MFHANLVFPKSFGHQKKIHQKTFCPPSKKVLPLYQLFPFNINRVLVDTSQIKIIITAIMIRLDPVPVKIGLKITTFIMFKLKGRMEHDWRKRQKA